LEIVQSGASRLLILIKYQGDFIKKNEMGGAYAA